MPKLLRLSPLDPRRPGLIALAGCGDDESTTTAAEETATEATATDATTEAADCASGTTGPS